MSGECNYSAWCRAGQMDKAGPSTIGSVTGVQHPLILIIMHNIKSSVTSRRSTIPDCLNATTDTTQDATIVMVTRPRYNLFR
jgi:hypothetical protein